jgi:hypothetical protein
MSFAAVGKYMNKKLCTKSPHLSFDHNQMMDIHQEAHGKMIGGEYKWQTTKRP